MDDLRTILIQYEIESYDRKTFIPFSVLKDVFTKEAISSLMRQASIELFYHNEIIRTVLSCALRLFAILVVIGETKSIQKFIEADHTTQPDLDSKLPFDDETLKEIWSESDERKVFIRKQWMFLSPYIEADQAHRRLSDRAVLPFTAKEKIGAGGYGNVYKVRLAASQHSLNDAKTLSLLVKRLR
ncbi:hypothetical protein EJ04DRAFT_582591 [Polyplosphaeria fusca]|uniref:Protein kinase domain-containing protein n=1 Tax=Polyplosphaeria fusca TaxID=682080 RepID=A0A9P4QFZ0_9PLEO|nr:hypothetical protein EJ04DRAFT_582591 [Polyplosphaeria fusca]